MKIVSFPEGQRSKEWLDWRKNGIGASDISVIQGSNKYKTPLTLWDEKCGFKSEDEMNFAMTHGVENEDKALQWINENQQLNLEPLCVEDNELSYFKASLDGYDLEKKVLCEIKCPVSDEILNKAREDRTIPLYWQHQIQWQIMLTKPIRAFVAIWDYRYDSCVTIEAFAQPTLQKEMREKGKEFWRMVQMGVPPKPTEKDYLYLDDPELKALLVEYKDHDSVEKAAKEHKKKIKEKIVEFGDDGNFSCGGFFISRCAPRVTYDLDQMRLDGIDVDGYAKKNSGIGYYKISCPRN
jgi:putative phage-type endonuclease